MQWGFGRRRFVASTMAVSVLLLALPAAGLADDRRARQAELDQACEAARAVALQEARAELTRECVAAGDGDQASCSEKFATHGNRAGSRPALFYDLPECEAAAEFQRSSRQAR